ncbi:MAG: hypothetical protein U0869_17115 [Chloroflexota bacterium]
MTSDDPGLTGDTHIDARLEAWRPASRRGAPLDGLPSPGRERRARAVLIVVTVIALVLLAGYVAIAFLGAAAGR